MTSIRSTQRFNMICAWAGALLALGYDLGQKDFPPSPAEHPSMLAAAVTCIFVILICLHCAKRQRWTVTGLCFALGALFTTATVFLVRWSSSLW